MKPQVMFQIKEWKMCCRCIQGKHGQCQGNYKAEGTGRTGNGYRKCECEKCNE